MSRVLASIIYGMVWCIKRPRVCTSPQFENDPETNFLDSA